LAGSSKNLAGACITKNNTKPNLAGSSKNLAGSSKNLAAVLADPSKNMAAFLATHPEIWRSFWQTLQNDSPTLVAQPKGNMSF